VYYFGTSDGQLPDGSYVEPTKEILFIRTVDPSAATITEEFWQEGRDRNQWDNGTIVNSVDTSAQSFGSTWVTGDGDIETVGTFTEGEDWLWTAWNSVSTYQSGDYTGTYVTSDDQLDETGADTADKHVYDPDGTETWRILEVITPTDEASFNARLAEIEG
jgi:hypothetical protein